MKRPKNKDYSISGYVSTYIYIAVTVSIFCLLHRSTSFISPVYEVSCLWQLTNMGRLTMHARVVPAVNEYIKQNIGGKNQTKQN